MVKPTRHLLNIEDSELDRKVHRFISFESLCEVLLFKRLTLLKIDTWDDPYENFLFKTHVLKNNILPDNTLINTFDFSPSLQEVKSRLYGQCWTLTPESDALWRIYSSNDRGIRISTTLRKLYEVINISESTNDSVCLGKVKYLSLDEIEESIRKLKYFPELVNAEYFFNSTLIKRNEFLHENEVRIIYSAGLDFKRDIKQYDISINDFIETITFDPRINTRYDKLYRAAIDSMGFKNEVMRSGLYDFNRLSITIT